MLDELSRHHSRHIFELERIMEGELDNWPWQQLPRMLTLLSTQLHRSGKHLRPLLMFSVVEFLGGEFSRAYPAAAGVELFHTASLILDDIQDNSDFRRGTRTVHATTSCSTAINLAGIIRSLSYQPLHRCEYLEPAEKEQVHRRLNTALTHLFMGQTIDIGWREGWYRSIDEFPYEQMISWKTAALFRCAAGLAALVSGASAATITAAEHFGDRVGIFYQMLNDYLDVFGSDEARSRPESEDLREGKPSWPVLALYRELMSRGGDRDASRLASWLTEPGARSAGHGWILALMRELDLGKSLGTDLLDRAAELAREVGGPFRGSGDPTGLNLFTQAMMRLASTGDCSASKPPPTAAETLRHARL
jgi:geranylgeranyl pyrophosphate synthase